MSPLSCSSASGSGLELWRLAPAGDVAAEEGLDCRAHVGCFGDEGYALFEDGENRGRVAPSRAAFR